MTLKLDFPTWVKALILLLSNFHLLAEETLIVVTADHSHTFVMGGYPLRGNPILGLVDENDRVPASSDTLDKMSYTTLGYLNGPGAKVNASRDNPARSDVKSRKYKQQSIVPRDSETHGGEDVGRCFKLMPSFLFLLSIAPSMFCNFFAKLSLVRAK